MTGTCNERSCPANGCDGHCALQRFIEGFPHLILEQRDNPCVCEKFREAAERLEGGEEMRDAKADLADHLICKKCEATTGVFFKGLCGNCWVHRAVEAEAREAGLRSLFIKIYDLSQSMPNLQNEAFKEKVKMIDEICLTVFDSASTRPAILEGSEGN